MELAQEPLVEPELLEAQELFVEPLVELELLVDLAMQKQEDYQTQLMLLEIHYVKYS